MNYFVRQSFGEALIHQEPEILNEGLKRWIKNLSSCRIRLEEFKNGINCRTKKPYRPSTIKGCEQAIRECGRVIKEYHLAIKMLPDFFKKAKSRRATRSKGKIIQLNNYQRG